MKDRDGVLMDYVNTNPRSSDLKITDIRVINIVGTPVYYIPIKVYTSQGLVGYGKVRDGGFRNYALAFKSRLIGENPCNTDKLSHRIEQFESPARQDGGVCNIELALWGLARKTYRVPVHQMSEGKFRDCIRMYRDTDIEGKHTDKEVEEALEKRMDKEFTFLKMGLGTDLLYDIPDALYVPLGMIGDLNQSSRTYEVTSRNPISKKRSLRDRMYDMQNIPHPPTGVQVTEYGYDILEQYVEDVRNAIGYEIPLAISHFGHAGVEPCTRLARGIKKYNVAWTEDLVPWQLADRYAKPKNFTTVPICIGEDIYLKENFCPLLERGGVLVIRLDILASGRALENKKIGDMAQEHRVTIVVHMTESPIARMATVHSIATAENSLALELHSADIPWWPDPAIGLSKSIVDNGYITVPDAPGLRTENLEDEIMREYLHPDYTDMWADTAD